MLGSAVQKLSNWSRGATLVRAALRGLPNLRRLMADDLDNDEKLRRIAKLIATEMQVDVCSIYVLRAGDLLELFATYGLQQTAVHHTHLRVGEGLVGTIAASMQPLNIADARTDERFAPRHETGEDAYHSFCGVPLMRDGKLRGVLVIQSRKSQEFPPEMVDMLAATGMLVTELVASIAGITREERVASGSANLEPMRVPGISFHHGVAVGRAVRIGHRITVHKIISEDEEIEHERLNRAAAELQDSFRDLQHPSAHPSETREILEAYQLFAADAGWLKRIHARIRQGLTAEAAVQAVQEETTARMQGESNLYLKDRARDFSDVSHRLLQTLMGEQADPGDGMPDDAILVAEDLSVSDLLSMDMTAVRGIVLSGGSPSSHVTIMARAMGIPLLGQCKNLLQHVEHGDPLILDADRAILYVVPPPELLEEFSSIVTERGTLAKTLADTPAPTGPTLCRDGTRIELHINAGLLSQLPDLKRLGADGIGLYRTEVPFIALGHYPSVTEQAQIYARVMMDAGRCPVMFRTLDIGSDKKVSYIPSLPEENPALGWRGIRIGLDRPALLRQQFRALILAANGQDLNIMLPMVAAVGEVQSARRTLNMECEWAARRRIPLPRALSLGVMLEVPSLMWQMPELLREVDFISVGSNDLFQYTYAVDRAASHLQGVFDPLCHGFLKMLREIIQICSAAGKPLSLCGEMGGKPLEALALLGLGYRSLSMSAPAIPAIRALVQSAALHELTQFMHQILDISPPLDYRAALRAFALDRRIELGPLPQTLPPMVG